MMTIIALAGFAALCGLAGKYGADSREGYSDKYSGSRWQPLS